jgi:hypothetical protein
MVIFMFSFLSLWNAHAEPCDECKVLHEQISKEEAQLDSFLNLKKRNEDYLKKPNVSQGAMIKVQSNLLLINIKVETSSNKIEALQLDRKKLNGCVNCPFPESKKS